MCLSMESMYDCFEYCCADFEVCALFVVHLFSLIGASRWHRPSCCTPWNAHALQDEETCQRKYEHKCKRRKVRKHLKLQQQKGAGDVEMQTLKYVLICSLMEHTA